MTMNFLNLIDDFESYPRFLEVLKKYIEDNASAIQKSDAKLREYVENIKKYNKAPTFEKLLAGKNISGLKPDVYLLPRNNRLVLDYSYHGLCKIVSQKYGETLEAFVFDKREAECIQRVSIRERTVEIDEKARTNILLNRGEFDLQQFAGVLVISRTAERCFSAYYTAETLMDASSTQRTETIDLSSPSVDMYGRKLSEKHRRFNKNKMLAMIKKTALRCYMKDFFRDLSDETIAEDEYVEFINQKAPIKKIEKKKEETPRFSSIELNNCAEILTACTSMDELRKTAETVKRFLQSRGSDFEIPNSLREIVHAQISKFSKKKKEEVSNV